MAQVTRIITSAIITNSQQKFLIVKRAANDTYPNMWEFPGGTSEFGEHPEDSVIREIFEETGLVIIPEYPVVVNSYKSKSKSDPVNVEIFYISSLTPLDQTVTLSNEHSDYAWIELEKIEDYETTEYIHKVIKQTKKLLRALNS